MVRSKGWTPGNEDLIVYPIADYINEIPGYTAQVLTFGLMIMVVIAVMAFLSMSHDEIEYVRRYEGARNIQRLYRKISRRPDIPVIAIGVGIYWVLTGATVLSCLLLFHIAQIYISEWHSFLVGHYGYDRGVFSVRAVVKIDPLKATG